MLYHFEPVDPLAESFEFFLYIKLYIRKLYTKLTGAQISAVVEFVILIIAFQFFFGYSLIGFRVEIYRDLLDKQR